MLDYDVKTYIITQLTQFSINSVKAVIAYIVLYFGKLLYFIEPYFFGIDFIKILTILMMSDLAVGVGKHLKEKTFSPKLMFYKFTFKLMIVALSTVSSKAIINIDNNLDSDILIMAVKLTIALYLFGNIEKNICKMTNKGLCFEWLIDKLKEVFFLIKTKK